MPHVHNGMHHYTQLLSGAARAVGEVSGAQDFTGIERFGETLTPVVNLWELPEWALLRGEVIFSRQVAINAAVGLFSSLELVNPPGSGVIATVLEIGHCSQQTQVAVDSGVALGAVATRRGLANDTRYPQLGEVSQCSLVEGNLAAGVALPQDFITTGARSTRPYIIVPGKKLFMVPTANNTANVTAIMWTERPLLPTEQRA